MLRALLALLLAAGPAAAAAPPAPRYESLRYNEVRARKGPSLEHRVVWTYRRQGLPVRVLAESGGWRRVSDPAGGTAWVRGDQLSAARTVYVAGSEPAALRRAPKPGSRPKALLAPGVVATLEGCAGGWRKLRAAGRTGWTASASLWGGERCR